MLKCPSCNAKMTEFVWMPTKEIILICDHCHYLITDKQEIQNIKACAIVEEFIESCMEIWRELKNIVNKFK